jgi:peptidoglycan DL-endopeptidase CwlO
MTQLFSKHAKKLKNISIINKKQLTAAVLAISIIGGTISFGPLVNANSYQAQINNLKQKNANNAAEQDKLENKETNLQQTINELRQKIDQLQGQIDANRAKSAQISELIKQKEAELDELRKILGVSVRELYLDDQMSTLEQLASSRDLSHFVDKQQYRVTVQKKIQEIMDKIDVLKKEQEQKKIEVEKLLGDQQLMQKALDADKQKANELLSLNQKQQQEYDQAISANNAKISELQRQQAIENARHNVSAPASIPANGGGSGVNSVNGANYPWANVPFPNSMPDPWGMYKRQCVSYTAWKVASSGRHMPYWGGRGNAKLWDDNARAAGIPVGSNPRVGSIAVSNAGTYGHVMYVEDVHGDGTITISDYNSKWDGRYGVSRRTTSGLVFIYF